MRNIRRLVTVLVAVSVIGSGVVAFAQKAKSSVLVNAIVKSVSATSLTASTNGKDTTFTIDPNTSVVGRGIGTKSREKGGKPAITDLIKEGARVSVTYLDVGGTLHASRVQVLAAAK